MPIGEPVLVFLTQFKPIYNSWSFEEQLEHFTIMSNPRTYPEDYYYGIWFINENGKIDRVGESYTVLQIKNIINVCNGAKFKSLKSRADLLKQSKQYVDALKLYEDAYKICPEYYTRISKDILTNKLEQQKLSWKLKQIGLSTLLFETFFFLLFFAMGYFSAWRWLTMLLLLYSTLLVFQIPKEVPLFGWFALMLPFVSYGLGALRHKIKKGTWQQDRLKDEMAQSFMEGEDEEGSYLVWEYEATIFSTASIIAMIVFSLIAILLLIYVDDKIIPTAVGAIPLFFLIPTLLYALLMFNRLRYRYGCYGNGYGYELTDGRMELISFLSVTAGSADRNATLAGSGMISANANKIRRKWSSVQWCRYDDEKKLIVINHGCCKSEKLYASTKSYKPLKAIVMKAIGDKCRSVDKKKLRDIKDVQ